MVWQALGGFGLNVASNYLSGLFNTGFQKELQENQAKVNYKYAEKSAKNTPTWNRAGLESAGYNPMLAVQNAVSGANSSWTSSQSVNTSDMGAGDFINNAQSFQRLENETKTAEATAENQHQQALTEETKRENLSFDSMMKDAQKHLLDKETSWYDKKVNADIYKAMQEAEQARAVASVQAYNAETARIGANAQQLIAQNESVSNPYKYVHDTVRRHLKSFEKDHPYLSKTRQFKSLTNFVKY